MSNMAVKKYRVYFNNVNKNIEYVALNVYVEEPEKSPVFTDKDIIKMAIRQSQKTEEWLDRHGWLFISVELKEVTLVPMNEFVSFHNRASVRA